MADPDDIVIDETEDEAATLKGKTAEIDEATEEKILPRGAELNADRSVTVKLDYPVTVSIKNGAGQVRQEPIEQLTFHRLTGADLNAFMAAAREHQQLVLFTRSTRQRPAVMKVLFEKMDAADLARCGKVVDTFF